MAYTTINKGSLYMNPVLWTGNSSTQAVTGVGFQPDWTWIKCRNDSQEPRLVDSVRGTTKYLDASLAIAELTDTNILTSFDTDGFTLGDDAISNYSGNTMVGWNWLGANGTSANTDGSIASTVSANTTSGFSVVTWTGTGANATVGHGLTSAPQMIILKNRDSAENWIVGNTSIGWTKYLSLNLSDSVSTASNIWQDTTPTSSFFSIGASGKVNGSTHGMVAYCFAEKKGFSKFGSFVSNNTSDNVFIYTGFKPAFLIAKSTTSTNNWVMFDNKRNTFNAVDKKLYPDLNNSEDTEADWDFLSNGLKLRAGYGANTYIYMAFAENPFVGSDGTPVTAR